MFTVITRTANRPKFFSQCRRSITTQTERPYHLVGHDVADDLAYIKADTSVFLESAIGRGHNLYFNTLKHYVPSNHPWIIFLDDDDHFTTPDAIMKIKNSIIDENSLILWQVQFPAGRVVPASVGHPPQPGEISGLGFCYHVKHWVNWPGTAFGDYFVISQLYNRLQPIWIPEVLTGLQAEPGGGRREDLPA